MEIAVQIKVQRCGQERLQKDNMLTTLNGRQNYLEIKMEGRSQARRARQNFLPEAETRTQG